MSIESTYTISRSDAIEMLKRKNVTVFNDDSNDRLGHELYNVRESEFENYEVVDFDKESAPQGDNWRVWKYYW